MSNKTIAVLVLTLAFAACGSSEKNAAWLCSDLVGSEGPVMCACDLAEPGHYNRIQPTDPDIAPRCIASSKCCELSEDKTECNCFPTDRPFGSSCAADAQFSKSKVVASCPPP
jgi:hypothetical protein